MAGIHVKGILIDLDHTLWDFARNSREAIYDVFTEEKLGDAHGIEFDLFHTTYIQVNDHMWDQYRKQEIDREKLRNGRFAEVLKQFNVNDTTLALRISNRYLEISPYKKHVFPGTHETLKYLQSKYPIAIVTNGFNEVQFIKIKQSGLDPYFTAIITSEEARSQKPEKDIFHLACSRINVPPNQCVMIGDNWEADMVGAKNAGLQRIHFDPDKIHTQSVEKRIHDLRELQTLL